MAFENVLKDFPFTAEAAMTATDYRFVIAGTTPDLVDVCGANGLAIGVRRNSPAIGKGVDVVSVGSIAKLTIGTGGVAKAALIKSDAAGAGVTADTDKDNVRAQALEAGDENDVISVLLVNYKASI